MELTMILQIAGMISDSGSRDSVIWFKIIKNKKNSQSLLT